MGELKTKENKASVSKFINSLKDERQRKDSKVLLKVFKEATGKKAKMWGTSIIGFGKYHYKSERSSQEGDWPLTGFSPRKGKISIYIMNGFSSYNDLMEKLGKHKVGKSCLYLKNLEEVSLPALKQIIKKSFKEMSKKYSS